MKKIIAIVMAMMLVLSAAAMAETVKIGVFEPASGDSGAGGKQEMLGMQYANKETPTVEIGGTTYDVELVCSTPTRRPPPLRSAARPTTSSWSTRTTAPPPTRPPPPRSSW